MKWISIEEKIPDDGQKCLITDGDTVVSARWFSGESGIWCSCGFGGHEWEWDYEPEQSTHWMPLPEPPRAGVVENFAHEPTKELQTEALNKHNVGGRSEQFYCADWNRCGAICEEQCPACAKTNLLTEAQ